MQKFLTRPLLALASLLLLSPAAFAAKNLVFCSEASPEGFYPALFTAGATFDAAAQPIYNRLAEFEIGTTKVIPALATKWEISKDGLSYTFFLRKGVKFHANELFKPSRDFNADDVIFSFERMWKKDNPYHMVSGGTYVYFNDMGMGELIDRIEKKDDYTLVFHLKKSNSTFLANIAMDFASIASKEYADLLLKENKKEQLDLKPIGTGPFQFVAYQKDAFIRYQAFDHYWDGKPKIDNLVFAITLDPAVRLQKLKANECQVMRWPSASDMPTIRQDKNIKIYKQNGLSIGYMAFNAEKKPLDRAIVRRALSLAIDKKAILDAVYQELGQPAVNPIPPTMWSYNKKVKDLPYNPDDAQSLLDQAGVKGLTLDLWAMPARGANIPNGRRIAELIQNDWKKVGVNAKIITYEWGEYLKRAKNKEHDAVLMGWTGDNGDPDNFLGSLLSCASVGGNNYAEWCNKDFDALIIKARSISDIKERTKLYEQAQVIAKQEAPWFPIAYPVVIGLTRNNVVNFKLHPLGTINFAKVSLQ